MRVVRRTDVEWLEELLVGERGARWKYRGRTPSPADFEADLWRGVFSQWVVEDSTGNPVGLVGLYNHRPAVSAAHLFAVAASDCGGLVSEAAGLLLNWGFDELDLDKVWIETPEFNLAQFRTIKSVAEIEGRLRDFDHWRGRFWDLYILSIRRSEWKTHRLSRLVDARKSQSVATVQVDEQALVTELSELADSGWPLDSLGCVEALTILEAATGTLLNGDIFEGIGDLDPHAAIAQLVAKASRCGDGQQSGLVGVGTPSSAGNGHEPSSVT